MARDRQRSKARQRQRAAGQQPRGKRSRAVDDTGLPTDTTPDELEGAMPYVDEARAAEAGVEVPAPTDEPDYEDFERGADEVEVPRDLVGAGGGGRRGGGGLQTTEDDVPGEPKDRGRVLTFLRACVDELRRVQWPDRKHVFQATAVVLVFCLIAGLYLGALDAFLWQPLINALL